MDREKYNEYHRNYYKNHSEYWKKRIKERMGYYLYMYVSLIDGRKLYIGKTVDFNNRLRWHENNFGNVLFNIWEDEEIYTIKFCDLYNYLENGEELLFAEKYLMEKYKPLYNDIKNGEYNITEQRKQEIINLIDNLQWEELEEVQNG